MKKSETASTNAARDFQQIVKQNIVVRFALCGRTQKEFADALLLSQGTVSLKLNGRQDWTADDIANAAAFFGCNYADLVTDRVVREIAPKPERDGSVAPAGARYFVRPEYGDGRNPGRNGRARAFVMPGAMDGGSVPRVGTEPLFVFAGLGVDRETAAVRRFALLCALGSRDAIIRRG